MNDRKRLSIQMGKLETALGILYFPFFLTLTAFLLTLLFEKMGWPLETAQDLARLNGLYFLVNFLAVVLIFHRFLWKSLLQAGSRFWGFVQAVILGMVLYYVGTYLVNYLILLIEPNLRNVNDASIQTMAQASPGIMLVGSVFLVPLAEECMVRGLLFGNLYRRSRLGAYGIATLLFCAIHVWGYIGAFPPQTLALCALQYVPAGIALGWAYEKADTIFAPVLMHCAINAISFGVLT